MCDQLRQPVSPVSTRTSSTRYSCAQCKHAYKRTQLHLPDLPRTDTFCLSCLADWIRSCRARGVPPRCPSCNRSLGTDPDALRVNTDIAHAIETMRASAIPERQAKVLFYALLIHVRQRCIRAASAGRRRLSVATLHTIRACASRTLHPFGAATVRLTTWCLVAVPLYRALFALFVALFIYLCALSVLSLVDLTTQSHARIEGSHASSFAPHLAPTHETTSTGRVLSTDASHASNWHSHVNLPRMLGEACDELSEVEYDLERLRALGSLAEMDEIALDVDDVSATVLAALNDALIATDDDELDDNLHSFCDNHDDFFLRGDASDRVAIQRRLKTPSSAYFLDWVTQSRQIVERGAAAGYAAARAALGRLRFDDGDFELALTSWRQASAQGDPDAFLDLGEALASAKNFEGAVHHFKRAAAKVHFLAFAALGNAYLHGRGVRKSVRAAERYFRIGAALWDPEAMFDLGRLLLALGGGRIDGLDQEREAWHYIHEAALAGHDAAILYEARFG